MDCSEFKLLVHAFVDGEFDDREETEARVHLESCEACRALAHHEGQMRAHFKASYTPEKAPDQLRERLMLALSEIDADDEDVPVSIEPAPDPHAAGHEGQRRRLTWALVAIAAVLLAVFGGVAYNASTTVPEAPVVPTVAKTTGKQSVEPIVEESVNWHRRNVPIEIAGPSGDRIKTWLRPKVDFPVRLPRFDRVAHEDVSLLGARLSNIREKQAAYVVYEVDGNKISVMLFDGPKGVRRPRTVPAVHPRVRPAIYTANGYNVAVLEQGGVTYSVTSELPREDMAQLVDAAFSQ